MTATEPDRAETLRPAVPRGKPGLLIELVGVLALFAFLLAVVPLGRVVGGGPLAHLWMVGRMLIMLGVATWLLRRSGQSWADMGLTRPRSWWRVAGLVLGAYVVLGIVMRLLLPLLLRRIGGHGADLGALSGLRGNLWEYLFFAFPVAFGTAAFIEELFARGYLLNRLTQLLGRGGKPAWGAAAVGQAFVFALGHAYQGVGGMIGVFFIGLLLGGLYLLARRNLWACIILHGLIDFASITALYLGIPVGA